MKIIYSAANIMEAHIVAGMLQIYEINAHVSGHYLQGGIGELAPADFANVLVDESDIEKALPIIRKYESADVTDTQFPEEDGMEPEHGT